MSKGEFLTRATIWAALICYACGAALLLTARGRVERLRAARWFWTLGCGVYLAHVICAFQFYHGWSHAAAYRATARQVGETVGWAWGGGVFVNYLFTLLWLWDVWRWWRRGVLSYTQRSQALLWAWHGFFFLLAFNGTVVFAHGPPRWLGLALTAVLGLSWLSAQYRAVCN